MIWRKKKLKTFVVMLWICFPNGCSRQGIMLWVPSHFMNTTIKYSQKRLYWVSWWMMLGVLTIIVQSTLLSFFSYWWHCLPNPFPSLNYRYKLVTTVGQRLLLLWLFRQCIYFVWLFNENLQKSNLKYIF